MATIDIGSGAYTQADTIVGNQTIIDINNPANLTGTLNSFQIRAYGATLTGFKIGTFSGNTTTNIYSGRAYTTGDIAAGSLQSLSGFVPIAVTAGDFIGAFWTGSGRLYVDSVNPGYDYVFVQEIIMVVLDNIQLVHIINYLYMEQEQMFL